jgi:predicted RND superfamily exporter protein
LKGDTKIPEFKKPEPTPTPIPTPTLIPIPTVSTVSTDKNENKKEKKEPKPEKEPEPEIIAKKPEKVKEPDKLKREATTNEKFKSQVSSLHTVVSTGKKAESRFVHSLRKAINLNDRYRYQRELFKGNIELMNQVVEKLDTMKTLKEAMDYVQREFSWDSQSETVADFYSLLENRFS